MKTKTVLMAVIFIALTSVNLFAQRTSDVEGGKDYPLVSRFSGSIMEWYQVKNFDRYYMLTLKDSKLDKYEIDGKITRIQYSSQQEHSTFEIYKSYENALKNAGFDILLMLDKTNCSLNLSEQLYNGEFNGLNAISDRNSMGNGTRDGADFTYLSAKKKMDGKDIYIVVYISYWDNPLITFDAIEVKSMDKGLVSVNDLETGLAKNGHIAIYDIHFDTGKSEIKLESAEAMKNIAEYLNANTDKKFVIVGHTDNVGDFDTNIKLSKERANTVITEFVNKYGVKSEQLKAFGAGSVSPIATNSTDEGRSKNRRVEIVEQ